jgi:hypothetical protein
MQKMSNEAELLQASIGGSRKSFGSIVERYQSLICGSIFGSVCWIFVMSAITKDWLIALSVLIFAVVLFVISTKVCLRGQCKYWRIVITDMILIALLTFVAVNLRWGKWMEFYREDSSRFEMPLWGMNLIVLAIFGGLLGIFFLIARKESQLREIKSQGDEQSQEKTARNT